MEETEQDPKAVASGSEINIQESLRRGRAQWKALMTLKNWHQAEFEELYQEALAEEL